MAEILFKDENIEVRIEKNHPIVSEHLLFFHTNEFITRKKNAQPFFLNLYKQSKPLVSIAFEVVDDVAINLPKSPFGDFIFNERIDVFLLKKYLKTITNYFKEKKLSIQIKLAPDSYDQFHEKIGKTLTDLKFKIEHIDIDQYFIIRSETFSENINRNRKRKLKTSINQKFVFKELGVDFINQAYNLIEECRLDKKYPVTMTLEELKESFYYFPDKYFLFGVFDQNELIASAVSVKVNSRILYNFYHGDKLSYRKSSPVTLLVAGIYEYCQKFNYKILDLGISTNQGIMNKGLYSFKKSFGANTCHKTSYQLNWDA